MATIFLYVSNLKLKKVLLGRARYHSLFFLISSLFLWNICVNSNVIAQGNPLISARNIKPPATPSTKKALILYDSNGASIHNGHIASIFLANLLGHFRFNYLIQPIESYKASQLDQFEPIFYFGTIYDNPLPPAFLRDVLKSSNTIVWFGYNLWQLNDFSSNFAEQFGFIYDQMDTSGYDEINYKNKTFVKNSSEMEFGRIKIIHPRLVDIHAIAKHKEDTLNPGIPYIIQGQRLWYFADIPFTFMTENNRYLILADLLYDILGIHHSSVKKRAIIRLEDVNPTYDVSILRKIADYLYAEHVPFAIAVIPCYVDPLGYYNQGQPQLIKMTDRPEFIQTLKYMISKGGSLIIHGYTHQYNQIPNPFFGVSGSDYEFYRIQLDGSLQKTIMNEPVAEDSLEWVQSRVAAAEALFKEANLETDIWETPHYSASQLDNQFFSSHFKAQIGRITYYDNNNQKAEQFFPYIIHQDTYGNKIIPENLGCFAPNQWFNFSSRTISDILLSAEKNLAIRNAWASTCYHPYLGLSHLKSLIIGLKHLGYEFVSLSEALDE